MFLHTCTFYGLTIQLQCDVAFWFHTAMDSFTGFTDRDSAPLVDGVLSVKLLAEKPPNFELPYTLSSTASASDSLLVLKDVYLRSITTIAYHFKGRTLESITVYYEKSLLLSGATAILDSALQSQHLRNLFSTYIEQALNWYILQKHTQLDCFHAAGVIHANKAYVFTGQNGVGKSSLAQILIQNPSWQFLGDNYILCSKSDAVVARDRVRLADANNLPMTIERDAAFGFGKSYVKLTDSANPKQLTFPLASIFVVRRSNRWAKTQLNTNTAHGLIHLQQAVSGDECALAPIAQMQIVWGESPQKLIIPKCQYFLLETSTFDSFDESIIL